MINTKTNTYICNIIYIKDIFPETIVVNKLKRKYRLNFWKGNLSVKRGSTEMFLVTVREGSAGLNRTTISERGGQD